MGGTMKACAYVSERAQMATIARAVSQYQMSIQTIAPSNMSRVASQFGLLALLRGFVISLVLRERVDTCRQPSDGHPSYSVRQRADVLLYQSQRLFQGHR